MTPTTTPATSDRPLRADARRNREKIVAAAHDCFALSGADAQVDDVARKAGVGVGTLYRHFPTKEALLAAVATAWFGTLADTAEQTLADEPAAEAFFTYLQRGATIQSESRGLCDQFFGSPEMKAGAVDELDRLRAAVRTLVAQSQDAGTLRADFQPDDVPLMMCGLGRIQTWSDDPLGWQRHLDYVVAGLRAG